MKAVILCAGKGTRLGNATSAIPKPMILINNKPILHHHIDNLKRNKVYDIFINTHYLSDVIMNYFGNGEKYGVNIKYSYEKELLGTGGALIPFRKYFDDTTLVVYADVYTKMNFQKLLQFHEQKKAMVTAVVDPATHPMDCDLVEFDNENILKKFHFKPHTKIPLNPHNLSGFYIFDKSVYSFLPTKLPFDLVQNFLPILQTKKSKICCYNSRAFMMDIGTPDRLAKAKRMLLT